MRKKKGAKIMRENKENITTNTLPKRQYIEKRINLVPVTYFGHLTGYILYKNSKKYPTRRGYVYTCLKSPYRRDIMNEVRSIEKQGIGD